MIFEQSSRSSRRSGIPGWMITYADTMGILLTFFIVLVSFSNVDANKYRNIADAMEKSFGPNQMIKLEQVADKTTVEASTHQRGNNGDSELQQQLLASLESEVKQGLVDVTKSNERIVIRFPERVVFPSGSAEINGKFTLVVDKIIPLLAKSEGAIIVAGHTDDIPIDNDDYRSNWELSAARAVSVIHAVLSRSNIPSNRFVAEGHADTQPLTTNDSPSHRASNRRVEISIKEQSTNQIESPNPLKGTLSR